MLRRFKLKGRIPEDDLLHRVVPEAKLLLAPYWVYVEGVGYVPQYAPTVMGASVAYDPANDCCGYFTSYKFQADNNCYNYATDIATNTFAHPGRKHGLLIEGHVEVDQVILGAQADGLILVGGPGTTIAYLREKAPSLGDGHLVALLIAPADDSVGFPGRFPLGAVR